MNFNNKYSVLIGSYARNACRDGSDCDIVRVCHMSDVVFAMRQPRSVYISYVDYDEYSFEKLFEAGSLFFYHMFYEGILLEGDTVSWHELKESFQVASSFSGEIEQDFDLLAFINSDCKYCSYVFAYLSSAYRAIKNIAIFRLAEKKTYVFDKFKAMASYWSFLTEGQIQVLIHSNDLVERESKFSSGFLLEAESLARFLYDSRERIEGMRYG